MSASAAIKPRAKAPKKRGRQSFSDQAYQALKRRILDNQMVAGFQATEHELSELLGMSRTPVREAMLRLANEGLVEIRPRHGMRVLAVSAEDMREIYEILTCLEATAAEQVACRNLSTQEIEDLEKPIEAMEQALEQDDLEAWAKADEDFHLLLVEYCGNQRLTNLVGTFWDQTHRVRMLTLRLRPKPTQSNADHRAVFDAIIRCDPEAAYRIHYDHRVRSAQTLVGILETHGWNQL